MLAILLAAGLSACGMIDSDPHRFENLADRVASVPLDGSEPSEAAEKPAQKPVRTAEERGMRPALKVEVLDPHTLWDVRDGVVRTAAPAVAQAVVREASARVQEAAPAELRPALPPPAARSGAGLVQLGAYSSESAARDAWNRLKSGPAAWALDGLSPVYEPVEIDGRRLVRLKVRAPGAGAGALCAAAGVDDPWCRRTA
ncbi:SPOR domain-containing protein [Brevundimonas lenta]|uniref:SPOR domain-containing protein n=1 Tax=Brevundimonas lenta TaxID=424796 RepID=A0A7W6JFD2_9CAUL|nr:SPOR domain-containing protein [Brevundimonas lenta]MBB4083113.1 hypothetical protein [Brevundimonas lenta]